MRLLNTSTHKLSEFFGNQIPKYAILSHTWGQEEIEYRDLAGGNFTQNQGFFKLDQCCRQAFSSGYTYVWIDTCCIDKSSSAELTEAINSMCHWYQNAQVCYAFLEDVGGGDPYEDDSEFRRSRWFTRGWTLQELLFPQVVEFYDKSWKKIEFRTSPNARSRLLSEITNIDPLALEDVCYAFSLPAATRISWASNRNTTRIEDMAYCLLGLLQVNLPLLYGEGDRAFVRLQREVISASRDTSILAWGIGQPWGDIISHTQSSSVLGRSPADFRNAFRFSPQQLSPRKTPKGDELHFMYTNAGLRIQLPILFIWETDMALAFLDSAWPRKLQVRYTHHSKSVTLSTFYVAIPLERINIGGYRRLQGCSS
ncbi:hypothetical protein NUW58_g9406 [Xylaria curta]|uniref:Uncharacterized protein n=1 Tax=Xylaria curta TaxID=42375 RepID=A0ACC1MXC7_9PEZI|nr:hypothetical protein NUW58_g9406 [Xylaria curta]